MTPNIEIINPATSFKFQPHTDVVGLSASRIIAIKILLVARGLAPGFFLKLFIRSCWVAHLSGGFHIIAMSLTMVGDKHPHYAGKFSIHRGRRGLFAAYEKSLNYLKKKSGLGET